MIKINFWGDFKATTVEGLRLSPIVHDIISSAQVNVINFEAPLLPSPSALPIPKSGPTLYQDAKGVQFLEQQGFNLVSLANNHMMDYSSEGLQQTKNAFIKAKTFGAGNWEEAYSPCFYVSEGVKIAILGLSHYEFGMLADRWDTRYDTGIAWINHPDVDSIIIKEIRRQCDYLIVFAHAGVEHIEQPLPEWRDRYHSLIDLGCDAVIASHPHIAQGWEIYKGSPIVYSLGNFYFPKAGRNDRRWHVSLCATLMLAKGQTRLQITPLVFDESEIRKDDSCETTEYLQRINDMLSDEKKYMDYINKVCLDKLNAYDGLFSRSGYVTLTDCKLTLRRLASLLRCRKTSSVHLLNNLRCESHRWCIARGIKLRDQYQ